MKVSGFVEFIAASTGILSALFAMVGMSFASLFFWFKPEMFTAGNWLAALATCAGLIGGVVVKRGFDNSKLAKDGVGDGGK